MNKNPNASYLIIVPKELCYQTVIPLISYCITLLKLASFVPKILRKIEICLTEKSSCIVAYFVVISAMHFCRPYPGHGTIKSKEKGTKIDHRWKIFSRNPRVVRTFYNSHKSNTEISAEIIE